MTTEEPKALRLLWEALLEQERLCESGIQALENPIANLRSQQENLKNTAAAVRRRIDTVAAQLREAERNLP